MKKGKGRPKKIDVPVEPVLNWKTFDIKPPHGEIVYVKGKKITGNYFIRRLGDKYFTKDEIRVDPKQFTHWRFVY
jgi:hypothetical protein